MSSELIGAFRHFFMDILMFLRMSIAFTMGVVGFIGFIYLTSWSGSLFFIRE